MSNWLVAGSLSISLVTEWGVSEVLGVFLLQYLMFVSDVISTSQHVKKRLMSNNISVAVVFQLT